MANILKVCKYIKSGENFIFVPFPNPVEQLILDDYQYTAKRMGGAPSVTAKAKHRLCLDDIWTDEVCVVLNGERYFIKDTPGSLKNNTSELYEHDITFVSERSVLDGIFFIDSVYNDPNDPNPQDTDKYVSNNTTVTFMGTIHEFAGRLNSALRYSGLGGLPNGNGYYVTVDEGITSNPKLMSFTDKYFSEVLQEIFNTYKLPYYFKGKEIHIGYTGNVLTEVFEYGLHNHLLSVEKQNANKGYVNRMTGVGSSDNLPHYYPNTSAQGSSFPHFLSSNTGEKDDSKLSISNATAFASKLSATNTDGEANSHNCLVYHKYQKANIYGLALYTGTPYIKKLTTEVKTSATKPYTLYYLPAHTEGSSSQWGGVRGSKDDPSYINKQDRTLWLEFTASGSGSTLLYLSISLFAKYDEAGNALCYSTPSLDSVEIYRKQGNSFIQTDATATPDRLHEGSLVWENGLPVKKFCIELNNLTYNTYYARLNIYRNVNTSQVYDFERTPDDLLFFNGWEDDSVSPHWSTFVNGLYNKVTLSEYGIKLSSSTGLSDGDMITRRLVQTSGASLPSATVLMPSIYRQSNGAERFYNAKNSGWTDAEKHLYEVDYDGTKYLFENIYSKNNPHEGKNTYDDIKPTVQGMTNANGEKMDVFLDVAFDINDDDNYDAVDGETSAKYKHPYFFVKLSKTSGRNNDYGFNLFDQACSDGNEMTVEMTSGACGACRFTIMVDENTGKNTVQVSDFGTLIRDEDGKVKFGAPQDRQNDTRTNEVWICLRKEDSTYGQLMPNAKQKLRPKAVTDTFVYTNIEMPVAYILDAEDRLSKAIVEDMWKNNSEKFNFSITFSRIYLAQRPDIARQIDENVRIPIKYNGKTIYQYVSSYTYSVSSNDALPEIKVELSDEVSVNQNSLQRAISEIKGDFMNAIGSYDALRSVAPYFLRKDMRDTAQARIDFLKGLEIGNYTSGNFGSGGVFGVNEDGSSYIEADFMYIRRKATFTELTIQELRHIGGQLIISPAAAEIKNVVEIEDFYRCFFNTTGGQTDAQIYNQFVVGDCARCQSFNEAWSGNGDSMPSGVNRYYWRLVVGVGNGYVDLSKEDCDTGSDVPQANDKICQLGNRDDVTRQNAQILSAYGVDAPSKKMYQHITCWKYEYDNDGNMLTDEETGKPLGTPLYSLDGKEVSSEAYNPETGRMQVTTYGDFYFGDRDKESYVKWDTGKKELSIKGKLAVGSTYNGKEFSEYIKEETGNLQGKIDALQKQVDGVIEAFNGYGAPTLNNYPANEWMSDEEKKRHDRDIYTDITPYVDDVTTPTSGQSWKWYYNSPTDYGWTKIADSEAVRALQLAQMSVTMTDVLYQQTTSQTVAPELPAVNIYGVITDYKGWATNAPSWKDGEYIWQTTYVKKGDGTATFSDPICISGRNGRGIVSVSEEYAIGVSPTEVPTDADFSEDIPTMTDAKPYLWNREKTTYTDGTVETTDAVMIGVRGQNGVDGSTVVSVINYYLASKYASGVTVETTGWTTDASASEAKTDAEKPYLWNYEVTKWSKGPDTSTTPHVVGHYGADGVGIDHMEEEYYLSTSPETPTGGSWKTEADKPTWEAGKYMWTRTHVYYTDGTDEIVGERCVTGASGTSVLAQYSSDGTSWHLTFTAGDIWMRTSSDGGNTWTPAIRIMGQDGQDGQYRKFQFAKNNSATTAPTTGWQDDPMTADTGEYVWMRSGIVVPPATNPSSWGVATRITGDKGDNGESVYMLDLSNEVDAIECDADGNVIGSYPISIASVWKGSTKITSGVTYSIDSVTGIVAGISSTGNITLSNITADKATINVKAVIGGVILVTSMSVYKVRPGANGEPATIYMIEPSVDNITKKADGTLSVSFVTCSVYKVTGNSARVLTNDKALTYLRLPDGTTGALTLTNGTSRSISIHDDTEAVIFELKDGNTLLDRERIPVVADGNDLVNLGNKIESFDYLKEALKGNTVINGGLVLSSLFKLGTWTGSGDEATMSKVYAGMNGIYGNDKTIAAWFGGDMIDIETAGNSTNPLAAKTLFRMDGTGYVAGGRLSWDASGNITLGSGIKIELGDTGGIAELNSTLKNILSYMDNLHTWITPVNSSLQELTYQQANEQNVYAIKVKTNFFATGGVSALGMGGVSGGGSSGGGGLIETVLSFSDITGTVPTDNTTVFNADTVKKIYDRLVSVEQGALTSVSWGIISGKPTTLAGYGISDGVNAVSVTGSGNAVTGASVSGHTLTLTKGDTYLTSITKAQVEAVLTGDITSHTHSQYMTSLPARLSQYITTELSAGNGFGRIASNSPFKSLVNNNNNDCMLVTTGYDVNWRGEIALDYRSNNMAYRNKNNGTWNDWALVLTNKNISSYAITSHQSLANYYTKSEVNSALGNYLPLTGGTLTGLLNVNVNGTTFKIGGQNASYVHLYSNVSCIFDKNLHVIGNIYAGASYNQLVWHQGNDGSGSGLDADLLDGKHNGEVTAKLINYNNDAGSGQVQFMQKYSGWNTWETPSQDWYSVIKLSHGNGDTYFSRTLAFDFFSNRIYTHCKKNNSDTGWNTIAFTSDNVASANKLQTARTITIGNTGKNFDGTANVSWSLAEIGALPVAGGVMTGNLILRGTSSADMTYEGNLHPRIRFDENGIQPVDLIYTYYDSYRSPAGIKLVGSQGGEWFEAPNIYATNFYGALSGNATSASKLATARTIWGQSFDGTGNVSGNLYLGAGNEILGKGNIHILKDYNNNNVTLSAASGDLYIGYDYTNNIHFHSGKQDGVGTEKMTLLASGNLGIGTTSPAYKLDVNGDTMTRGWLRTTGLRGWCSETYGGGWYMEDTTWLRTWNQKGIYSGAGVIRSDKLFDRKGYSGASWNNGYGAYNLAIENNNNQTPLILAYKSTSAADAATGTDRLFSMELLNNGDYIRYNLSSTTAYVMNKSGVFETPTLKIGAGLIEWDSANNAFKFNGNIYATGGVTCLG